MAEPEETLDGKIKATVRYEGLLLDIGDTREDIGCAHDEYVKRLNNPGRVDDGDRATVESNVLGGPPQTVGFVKGGVVYENVCGGKPRAIGYEKDGRAYKKVCGGPDRLIGKRVR